MILLQSFILGTSYQVKTLPGQPFEKALTRHIDDMKITSPIADFAKYPLGTVFISDGYDMPEDDHLHIRKENVQALFYENSVFPLAHLDNARMTTMVDYTVDYMIDNPEYGIEKAKEFVAQFESYGYICDWDSKIAPKPVAGESIPAGANLRRTIAANYPVPTEAECGFHIDPEIWFLLVRNVLRGENTLLIGPTGLTY